MRRFETGTIEDESVARLLGGLDKWSLELALDDEKYQRVTRFHELVYGDELAEVSFDDETAQYQWPCFSALSMGGHLIGARHRKTTPGGMTPLERHYAVVTGSVHSDEIEPWRIVPWRSLEAEQSVEMTIETPISAPNLTVVESYESPHDRALAEAARQIEQERLRQLSTRIVIGKQAWRLLKPDYVQEPIQSTYGLRQMVSYARLRGFTPREQAAAPGVEVIDNYS